MDSIVQKKISIILVLLTFVLIEFSPVFVNADCISDCEKEYQGCLKKLAPDGYKNWAEKAGSVFDKAGCEGVRQGCISNCRNGDGSTNFFHKKDNQIDDTKYVFTDENKKDLAAFLQTLPWINPGVRIRPSGLCRILEKIEKEEFHYTSGCRDFRDIDEYVDVGDCSAWGKEGCCVRFLLGGQWGEPVNKNLEFVAGPFNSKKEALRVANTIERLSLARTVDTNDPSLPKCGSTSAKKKVLKKNKEMQVFKQRHKNGLKICNHLGVTLHDLTNDIDKFADCFKEGGALIVEVKRGGLASGFGLKSGQIIVKVNETKIENVNDYLLTIEKELAKDKKIKSVYTKRKKGIGTIWILTR